MSEPNLSDEFERMVCHPQPTTNREIWLAQNNNLILAALRRDEKQALARQGAKEAEKRAWWSRPFFIMGYNYALNLLESMQVAPIENEGTQAAEPRECLCKYAIVQPPGDGGVVIHDERCVDAPYQRPEPRRNPYADWATWDDERNMYSARDIREAKFKAWNEGAQSAGRRDE